MHTLDVHIKILRTVRRTYEVQTVIKSEPSANAWLDLAVSEQTFKQNVTIIVEIVKLLEYTLFENELTPNVVQLFSISGHFLAPKPL